MRVFAGTLVGGLLLIAAPAATAANFTVDTTGDNPDNALDGTCEDLNGDCTLRAAIEESNATGAVDDAIGFDAGVFDGTVASATIVLQSPLTPTDALTIDGGNCGTVADPRPCTGLRGTGGFDGIVIAPGAGSELRGLALTNMDDGIVVNGAGGTTIQGNYLGVDLAGALDGNDDAGIEVTGTPDSTVETLIGGVTPADRNLISANDGDAIRVSRVDGVAVHGNRGAGNEGLFIDLEDPDGPGNFSTTGSAEGLQPPVAQSPTIDAELRGTGEPNATVRVFTKATISPGELGSLVTTTTADGDGDWVATFPAQPDGTRLAATQTVPAPVGDQTSEVGTSVEIGGGPKATITQGPAAKLRAKKKRGTIRVTFSFTASSAVFDITLIRFECSLDGGPFLPCTSPESAKVARGAHSFRVRARDSFGKAGPPAERSFKVVKKKKKRKKKRS